MDATLYILPLVLIPFIGVVITTFGPGRNKCLQITIGVSAVECVWAVLVCGSTYYHHSLFGMEKIFFVDMLSAYHCLLVAVVFLFSSLYGYGYFIHRFRQGKISTGKMSRYCILWNGFLTTMMSVLIANNMGILWVSLEATTLVSAFLILFDGQRASIEAMWKYLLICSVGIAFAFVSILLLSVASTQVANGVVSHTLLWTDLRAIAHDLNPKIMLAAFIFAIIGFGTKAGLAPMHTWLPDAHSQAPTPVSSVFSGVMLSCALYAIMRYLTLVEAAMGDGQARQIVLFAGLFSMIIAAIFIIIQHDIKRLLAYHSVEHIGIISVGLGLGGLGTFAALFHTVNHSLSKILAFYAAGRLIQNYKTRSMPDMKGAVTVNPLWGTAFFLAVIVLIGAAPFAIFMSELQILIASVTTGKIVTAGVFLLSCAIVFVSALSHAMHVSFGAPSIDTVRVKPSRIDVALVIILSSALLILGLCMPSFYHDILSRAAYIIEGR